MERQEHSEESLEMVKAERQAALQAEVEENCKFLDMSTGELSLIVRTSGC